MSAYTDYELALMLQNDLYFDDPPTPSTPTTKNNEIFAPYEGGGDELALLFISEDSSSPIVDFHLNYDFQRRVLYMVSQGKYHVYLKRVSTLDEAISITRDLRKSYRIIHLEFIAHGSATTLRLGKQTLRVGRDQVKLKELFAMLEPDALILALSCYSGKYLASGRDNLVTFLAKMGPGHRVLGTRTTNGPHLSLKVSCARPLKIKYKEGDQNVTVTDYYSK